MGPNKNKRPHDKDKSKESISQTRQDNLNRPPAGHQSTNKRGRSDSYDSQDSVQNPKRRDFKR